MMEQWKGKVAIVTGASAGIGAAIAQALVHHGMVVVGLARRQEKMQEMSEQLAKSKEPGKLYSLKVDLRQEEDILAAFDWVYSKLGGADVLVNNAGLAVCGSIRDGKTEDWRNLWEVNVLAVTICTREYLKTLEQRKIQKGHIFIINRTHPRCLYVPRVHGDEVRSQGHLSVSQERTRGKEQQYQSNQYQSQQDTDRSYETLAGSAGVPSYPGG
ncbi:Dehydrogenase/reductase SDR member 11, variant 2 [Homalodisca vitripennis]|nr:Dehydrogenase/reductase SDR member 11, variant 2 [Homalodisca vitripennis]